MGNNSSCLCDSHVVSQGQPFTVTLPILPQPFHSMRQRETSPDSPVSRSEKVWGPALGTSLDTDPKLCSLPGAELCIPELQRFLARTGDSCVLLRTHPLFSHHGAEEMLVQLPILSQPGLCFHLLFPGFWTTQLPLLKTPSPAAYKLFLFPLEVLTLSGPFSSTDGCSAFGKSYLLGHCHGPVLPTHYHQSPFLFFPHLSPPT